MRDNQKLDEIHERTRRIETRLTRFLAAAGFETGGRKPAWSELEGVVLAPNASVSVADCVEAIPGDWGDGAVPVACDGQLIGYVLRP